MTTPTPPPTSTSTPTPTTVTLSSEPIWTSVAGTAQSAQPAQSQATRKTYTAASFAVASLVLWALQKYVYKTSVIDPQTQAIIQTAAAAAVGYATSHFLSKKNIK